MDAEIADEAVHEGPVHPRVGENHLEGPGEDVDLPRGVAFHGRPEVHGIVDGHPFGKQGLEGGLGLFREVRDPQAPFFYEIRGNDAGPAAEGEDGDPAPPGRRDAFLQGEGAAEVHHLVEIPRLHGPGLLEGAGNDGGVSRQACRVAHGRLGPRAASPPREDHNGFAGLPHDIEEQAPLDDGFQIEPHHGRVLVFQEPGQEVAFVHVDLVAHGTDLADAHDPMGHDIDEESRREHAALHDQGDPPRLEETLLEGRRIHEGKDMTVDGVHEPHAVRPPETDAPLAGEGDEALLEGLTFRARLREAPGLDHHPRDPLFDT